MAFFSPFSPQKSGIADYSEELLPRLGDLADVDLVVGPYGCFNQSIRERFRIRETVEFLADSDSYDAVVYQIGNNLGHHGYMLPAMRQVPGILVLHDYCLQYLMLGLTVQQGNFQALVEILRPSFGASATWMALRFLLNAADPNLVSFAWPLVTMNKAVIVHSQFARDSVIHDHPSKLVKVIPMGVPDDLPLPAAGLRAELGFDESDFIIASISTLSRSKRLDVALRSIASVRRQLPRLKFVIVGGGSLGDQTREIIRELKLDENVVVTGWVPHERYRALIAVADLVVDLRYPSGAETSASLTRAIAAGKPLIVSQQGTFLEIPDDFSRKIPVGAEEEKSLVEAILELALNPELRSEMAQKSRDFFLAHLRLEQAASAYVEFAIEVEKQPQSAPFVTWPSREPHPLARPLIAAAYKATRLGYLYRNYGWKDTWRRVHEELQLKPEGPSS